MAAMDGIQVELDGVAFDGSDSDTIPAITLTSDTRLFGGVSMRREQTDRPTGHGQFWSPGFLSGRVITLAGEIYSRGFEDQERMIGQIDSLLADGSAAPMAVQRAIGHLQATVGRIGEPSFTLDRYGLLATYQAQFWAPDPRWYGDAPASALAASLDLSHRGNFPSLPTFTVPGSAAVSGGYTIAGPGGRAYVVTSGPAAGHSDEIDFATGWLRRDGALLFGAVSRYETWAIPKGANWTHTIAGTGAGTARMTARVPDTYV